MNNEKFIFNDIKKFREIIAKDIRQLNLKTREINFVGHNILIEGKKIFGYFEVVHGDKEDIDNFLQTFLELANDWQIIYEFIQNAFDANSKNIAFVFDQNYFISFNDGNPLTPQDIRALLNVAQTNKDLQQHIGRFGIGFKIIHRLIGETNGLAELKELNGPIIFSWFNQQQLKKFLSTESADDFISEDPNFKVINENIVHEKEHPWLFKILLTCFPCGLNEKIFDLGYNQQIPFNFDELLNFKDLLKQKLFINKLANLNDFNHGTIIYLPLKSSKRDILNNNISKDGLGISLSLLNKSNPNKKINALYINDLDKPVKPIELNFEYFQLSKKEIFSEINLSHQIREPIEIYFGYPKFNTTNELKLNSLPNFFYFFPIEDEKYNLNFILHSNAFYNLSDRTRLAAGPINETILKKLSKLIINKLNEYKEIGNIENYTNIFSSILTSSWEKNSWIYNCFLEELINYIKENIPTIDGNFGNKLNVRINGTNFKYKPSDFDQNLNYSWFFTESEDITSHAKNSAKLSLKEISLIDIISDASNLTIINQFIQNDKNFSDAVYYNLINKIKTEDLQNNLELLNKIKELKLFRVNGISYSINDAEINDKFIFIPKSLENFKEIFEAFDIYTFLVEEEANSLTNLIHQKFFGGLNNNIKATKIKVLRQFIAKVKNKWFSKDLLPQFRNIIEIVERDELNIWEFLVINVCVDKFQLLEIKNNEQNYFISNEKTPINQIIIELISKFSELNIFPIDNETFNLTHFKDKILSNEKLIEFLIDNIKSAEYLCDLIYLLENKKYLIKKYLDKDFGVIIDYQKVYDRNTFEHKVLELSYLVQQNITNKINVYYHQENINLKTLLLKKELKETINSKEFSIPLWGIFDDFDKRNDILDKIQKNFVDLNNEIKQFHFSVDNENDETVIEIIENKIRNKEKILDNSELLAYVLIFKTDEEIKRENYEIFTKAGKKRLSTDDYSSNKKLSYINEDYLLNVDENYPKLNEILQLNDENEYFYNPKNGIRIIFHPFFDKQTKEFVLGPVKNNLNLEQKSLIIKLLIENIKKDNNTQVNNSSYIKSLLQINNDFNDFIYPDEYALYNEKLPEDLVNITRDLNIDGQTFKKFLNIINIHTQDSFKVKLRMVLVGHLNPTEEELNRLLDNLNNINSNEKYLINTILWFKEKNLIFNSFTPKNTKTILKKIYKKLENHNSLSVFPAVDKFIDGEFYYKLRTFEKEKNKQVILISSETIDKHKEIKDDLIQFFSKNSEKLFFTSNDFEINFDKLVDIKIFEVKKEIDFNKMINNSEEINTPIYSEWKNIYDNKYIILKSKSKLFYYNYQFDNLIIKETFQESEFEIYEQDNRTYIFISNDEHNKIISVLENFNKQLSSKYEELLNKTEEIKEKNYSIIFDDNFPHKYETIKNNNKEQLLLYFNENEEKNFNKKLLQLLSLDFNTNKPWSGKIFHFTHVENAANILINQKILSRNKNENFKDSAGRNFITSTSTVIKNFVRFYFRPLTPTQFYNEHLGKETKLGDLPQCPVPIFFSFSLEEVIAKLKKPFYVSNGNLRHYPTTKFGNSYDFLKEFDFINIYKNYGECDTKDYLSASSQEFIVEDEFNFSDLETLEIICENEEAKETLLNLISIEQEIFDKFSSKIKCDNSFFYNSNPKVEIKKDSQNLLCSINNKREFDQLKIKIFVRNQKLFTEIFDSSSSFQIKNFRNIDFDVIYINQNNNIEWIVYKHSKNEIC